MKRARPTPHINEPEVANPSEMIAIGDNLLGCPSFIVDGQDLGRGSERSVSSITNGFPYSRFNLSESSQRAHARHRNKAVTVFCDGHVESPTLKSLFEDDSDEALSRWNRDHTPHRERLLL